MIRSLLIWTRSSAQSALDLIEMIDTVPRDLTGSRVVTIVGFLGPATMALCPVPQLTTHPRFRSNQTLPRRAWPSALKPASIPLSSRIHLDKFDAGLHSIHGAQEIISAIASHRLVTKLTLGYNTLGDDGCIALFKFLCSDAGRRYKINEISLNSNCIGDLGLNAISEYLKGNGNLRKLLLMSVSPINAGCDSAYLPYVLKYSQ